MGQDYSFDIASEVNLQEVDNAVNQVMKEVNTRFDFKGGRSTLTFNREEGKIIFLADDELKMENLHQILNEKLAKRGVAIKALKYHNAEKAFDGMIRQMAEIVQGISPERAREIVKRIKDLKIKVQPSIRGEQIRVVGRTKDDLQVVIQTLKSANLDLPLQFVNYR